MSRLDTWKKRLRITGSTRPKVMVQTSSRLETMTATQEWRFNELQRSRAGEPAGRARPAAKRAWYTLAEACERLAETADGLLGAAAAGELACYVATEGLRGRWSGDGAADDRSGRADVSHLRLMEDVCRDIAAYGSANVTVLRHPTINSQAAQFVLEEPLWVAPERVLLKHPLPDPGRV